jgi:hypothetical protein
VELELDPRYCPAWHPGTASVVIPGILVGCSIRHDRVLLAGGRSTLPLQVLSTKQKSFWGCIQQEQEQEQEPSLPNPGFTQNVPSVSTPTRLGMVTAGLCVLAGACLGPLILDSPWMSPTLVKPSPAVVRLSLHQG